MIYSYEERSFAKKGSGHTQKRRNVANERMVRVSKQGEHCSASIEVIRCAKVTSLFSNCLYPKTLSYHTRSVLAVVSFYQDRLSPKWMRELTYRSVLFCVQVPAAQRSEPLASKSSRPNRTGGQLLYLCLFALELTQPDRTIN